MDLVGNAARPAVGARSGYGGESGLFKGPGGGMVVKSSAETSLSSAATPPSLTKFMRRSGIGVYEGSNASAVSRSESSFAAHDSTLDSIMRRVEMDG